MIEQLNLELAEKKMAQKFGEEIDMELHECQICTDLLEEGVAFVEGCEPCREESAGCGCRGCDRIVTAESELLMVKGVTAGQA